MAGIIEELKRRHIYRIGAAYVVVAWLLLQLYNNMTPLLKVPGWAGTLVLVLLIGVFRLGERQSPPPAGGGGAEFRFAFDQGGVRTSLGTWCRTRTCGDLAPAARGQSFARGQ